MLNVKLNFGENFLRLEKIVNIDNGQYLCLVQNQTQSINQTFIVRINGKCVQTQTEQNS